ncbi:methyltransferase domain-containing protein [Puniceicoccales bacterium CK1056]|uniref:Methyltransferase domain-containing protein n=1 Tax=Oceanipulchritudo coccoides TaxID=2706888 RepID=A0A6B2M049_9BACT|nr:methyltransferase domain-containing protein [Oceanipulchritudo coccoides]NDV62288.1 methyltransferase domain-containing protein [Oceanipulchritudo coccoides]
MESAPGESDAFWEGRWQSGHTPWDHGRPAPPFAEFVQNEGAPTGEILIPGAGSGHDVRFFAELGARVTGLDIAPSAIEVAQARNPCPGARYMLGDILNPAPELHRQFDWVVEHTCLCAMEPKFWPAYAAAIPKLLRPGGHFLALFYRNPHDDAGPPFGIDEATIESLFEPRFSLLKAGVPKQAYESRAGREELRLYRLSD